MEAQAEIVEPQDPKKQNAPIGGEPNTDATNDNSCYWNGKKYSEFSTVCNKPDLLRCEGGRWALYGNC